MGQLVGRSMFEIGTRRRKGPRRRWGWIGRLFVQRTLHRRRDRGRSGKRTSSPYASEQKPNSVTVKVRKALFLQASYSPAGCFRVSRTVLGSGWFWPLSKEAVGIDQSRGLSTGHFLCSYDWGASSDDLAGVK